MKQYGSSKSDAVAVDISKTEQIPDFAHKIIEQHGDLDCVLVNSGIQRGADFGHPDDIDMSVIQQELTVNYVAPLALTKAFLPHLQSKPGKAAIMFTTSGLALVPILRCPNYCATKAGLHQFILCLREQLKESRVKVVEIYPPAVQTELHDAKHQPNIKDGHKIGMPLDDFVKEAFAGLSNGDDQVPVGLAKKSFDAFEVKRQEMFAQKV